MPTPKKLDYTPLRVLAVGAHPDDIDVVAGGTLAQWAKTGAEVEYLITTDGSKGSADTSTKPKELVALRKKEQMAAARTLGVKRVHFLSYKDGALELTMALKKDIVRVIRQVRPDTVVLMDPTMVYSEESGYVNHPDHRATGQATLDAIFPLARDCLTFPELRSKEKLEPHKVAHALLINFDKRNCLIDISETLDLKLAALKCHASQFTENNTVEDWVQSSAKTLGDQAKCKYAEGFVRIDLPE